MGRRLTQEEFIFKSRKLHGDKYDYSLVDYKNRSTPIKIICPEHGSFLQTPYKHLLGRGCRICGNKKRDLSLLASSEEILAKVKKIHGDSFDYSLFDYRGYKHKVKLICPKHGITEMFVINLLRGNGCNTCGNEASGLKQSLDTNAFIEKANTIHNNKYDYSLVDYKNNRVKVKIICPEHGVFEQQPGNHLFGQNCPRCSKNISKAEKSIKEYITGLLPDNTIFSDRSVLNGKELDIYIPNKKIGVEYNGLYWHSEIKRKNKNYHLDKTALAEKKGVRLVHIFEDEWLFKAKIVKSRIRHLLEITSRKIYAEDCKILEIDNGLSSRFFNKYNLFGSCRTTLNIGLFHRERLVALIGFKRLDVSEKYNWELARYCTVNNFEVINGIQLLLSYFRQNYNGSIVAKVDKRWFSGNTFKELNFIELKDSEPDYFYIKYNKRFSRILFQELSLNDRQKIFDNNLSELGDTVSRIWDCGNKIFVLK